VTGSYPSVPIFISFMVLAIAIGPVLLQPVFNKVTLLNDPRVTGPVLRLAHANGIATNSVYQIDASRQTTRTSANVSGFGCKMRITLKDNLLRRVARRDPVSHWPRLLPCSPICAVLSIGRSRAGESDGEFAALATQLCCRWLCFSPGFSSLF